MSESKAAPVPPEALEAWVEELRGTLGIDDEVDIAAILDLAKDFAHNVARPAAPLTTYAIGLAVGRAAGGGADPAAEFARLSELARDRSFDWQAG